MNQRDKSADPRTLTAWIRRGEKHPSVEATNDYTLKPIIWASTLGMALIGKYGSPEAALEVWAERGKQRRSNHKTYTQDLSELLNIPLEIVEKIARLVYEGAEPSEIMRMLRKGEIPF